MNAVADPLPARARAPRAPLVPGIRLLRIAWRLAPHLAVCALAVAAAWALGASASVRVQVLGACAFVAGWSLVRALVLEVLSPQRPGLRLVPLTDGQAVRVEAAARALLWILLLTEAGAWLLRSSGSNPSFAALLRMVRNAALVLFGAAALLFGGVLRSLRARAGRGALGHLAWVATRVLFPLAIPAGLALVVTHGLGYHPLFGWILRNLAWTGAQVLVAALAARWLRSGLRNTMSLGRSTGPTGGADPSPAAVGLERIGSGLIGLVVGVFAGLWILDTWDVRLSEVHAFLDVPIVGVGSLTWARFLGGVVAVGLVLLLARLVRTILTFLAFPRSRLDVGARYAILAMLRYVAWGLAILFGLGAIGADTASLAWFFGAAGIGVGLGLQDVLANFFSGLIMLLERPVRVGDLIDVDGMTGTVEEVRMRGTLIRTPQNTTVLVPNRQMMAQRLSNLSYGVTHGLVELRVGVAYATDPKRVERVLLEIARADRDVLRYPEAVVRFTGFGDSALEFVLLCHTDRVRDRGAVASALRFAVMDAFGREGIQIPAPQREVRLQTPPAPAGAPVPPGSAGGGPLRG